MTQQDMAKILSLIFSTYKREFKDHSEEDRRIMLGLWTKAFADKAPVLIMSAVEYYIFNDASGFAPTIGSINNILMLAREDLLGEAAAWDYVNRASANSMYYAKREFEKLPPIVQKVVGTPAQLKQWAMMDEDTFNTTVKREFKKEYKALLEEEKSKAAAIGISDRLRLKS